MQLKSIWIKRLIGWGLVVGILRLIFEPHGYLAVKYACAKDGGLYLPERLKTNSLYQSYNERKTYCSTCLIGFELGWFEYAENKFIEPNEFEPVPGVYRYSVSTEDDPRCEAWVYRGRYTASRNLGMPENQCIAIELVDEPASPFEYRDELEIVRPLLLADVVRKSYTVKDRVTGELKARMVRYAYASWATLPDSTSYRWQCEGQPDAYSTVRFLTTVFDFGD